MTLKHLFKPAWQSEKRSKAEKALTKLKKEEDLVEAAKYYLHYGELFISILDRISRHEYIDECAKLFLETYYHYRHLDELDIRKIFPVLSLLHKKERLAVVLASLSQKDKVPELSFFRQVMDNFIFDDKRDVLEYISLKAKNSKLRIWATLRVQPESLPDKFFETDDAFIKYAIDAHPDTELLCHHLNKFSKDIQVNILNREGAEKLKIEMAVQGDNLAVSELNFNELKEVFYNRPPGKRSDLFKALESQCNYHADLRYHEPPKYADELCRDIFETTTSSAEKVECYRFFKKENKEKYKAIYEIECINNIFTEYGEIEELLKRYYALVHFNRYGHFNNDLLAHAKNEGWLQNEHALEKFEIAKSELNQDFMNLLTENQKDESKDWKDLIKIFSDENLPVLIEHNVFIEILRSESVIEEQKFSLISKTKTERILSHKGSQEATAGLYHRELKFEFHRILLPYLDDKTVIRIYHLHESSYLKSEVVSNSQGEVSHILWKMFSKQFPDHGEQKSKRVKESDISDYYENMSKMDPHEPLFRRPR